MSGRLGWRGIGGPRAAAVVALLTAVYVAAAKLGLSLDVAHGNATAVWAPTGIALASVLLLGYRALAGVFLGAFIANVTTPIPMWAAVGIAAGNTLEALTGAWLLRRLGFRNSLDRTRDILVFSSAGATLSTAVSATVGVTTLSLANEIASGTYGFHWTVWWLGDLLGALLVAPLLLSWSAAPARAYGLRDFAEALVVVGALIGLGVVAFSADNPAVSYVIFPLLVWATLRFRQRGATTAVFVTAAVGVWAVIEGQSPFTGADPTQSVQVQQGMMGLLAVSTLILAATISERERAEEELRDKAGSLQRSEAALADAQRVARLGSWEWDPEAGSVKCSDEMYRLLGVRPASGAIDYDQFVQLVHPEDRKTVDDAIQAASSQRRPLALDYRVVLPDGSTRWLNDRGNAVTDGSGTSVRVLGTALDITDRKIAEGLVREGQAQLAEAQRLAHIGSWTWDLRSGRVTWSEEMYNIYGLESNEPIDFEKAVAAMPEEDRCATHRNIERALKLGVDNELPALEFRIRLPGGSTRVLLGRGRITFEDGRPRRMVGTVQDITEQKMAEEYLRELEQVARRQRQALDINDEIVQGLCLARYALETRDDDIARRAVEATLQAAQSIVSDLLGGEKGASDLRPGALVRERPARLREDRS